MLIHNEEQYQATCAQWYINTYRDKMLFTVDNNVSKRVRGYERIVEGNRKKALGVQSGVTDFIYIGFYVIAFIELKMWNGVQSTEQKQFQLDVERRGHQYFISTCFEFGDQIKEFRVLIDILKDQDETYRSKHQNKEHSR